MKPTFPLGPSAIHSVYGPNGEELLQWIFLPEQGDPRVSWWMLRRIPHQTLIVAAVRSGTNGTHEVFSYGEGTYVNFLTPQPLPTNIPPVRAFSNFEAARIAAVEECLLLPTERMLLNMKD